MLEGFEEFWNDVRPLRVVEVPRIPDPIPLPLTEDQIRERLGLLPWDEFARMHPADIPVDRRTGKTTRAIISAVHAILQDKSVVIYAPTMDQADTIEGVFSYLNVVNILGLPVERRRRKTYIFRNGTTLRFTSVAARAPNPPSNEVTIYDLD